MNSNGPTAQKPPRGTSPHVPAKPNPQFVKAAVTVCGVASALSLSFGVLLMLWAESWRVVPTLAWAAAEAFAIAAIVSRAKPGRLQGVGRAGLLFIVWFVTIRFALLAGAAWRLYAGSLSIILSGCLAGMAMGLVLLARRLTAQAREDELPRVESDGRSGGR